MRARLRVRNGARAGVRGWSWREPEKRSPQLDARRRTRRRAGPRTLPCGRRHGRTRACCVAQRGDVGASPSRTNQFDAPHSPWCGAECRVCISDAVSEASLAAVADAHARQRARTGGAVAPDTSREPRAHARRGPAGSECADEARDGATHALGCVQRETLNDERWPLPTRAASARTRAGRPRPWLAPARSHVWRCCSVTL